MLFMFVFIILSPLLIDALWSPVRKGLTSWLLFVMSNCDFVTFPWGILCQVWYLIALIPDLCSLSYFNRFTFKNKNKQQMSFLYRLLRTHKILM